MLLWSVLDNLQLAMELVMPDLCARVNGEPAKMTSVTEFKRCRVIHLVAEPASYHGLIDLVAEDEVDYRELAAGGGYMRGPRGSTLDSLPLGVAELLNVALRVPHRYRVKNWKESEE